MERRLIFILILLMISPYSVLAQTLIPATSEDINDFDKQVNEQLKKTKPDNFGSEVSSAAKDKKDADGPNDFGKWVSSQRKKADQGRPSAQGGSQAASVNHGASGQHGQSAGKGKKK